jgi:ABC-2 type transport system ATP-binding protein
VARLGKTILFSSHILADVAELCTRVGIIEAGKLVAAGSLDQLTESLIPHRQIRIGVLKEMDPDEACARLAAFPNLSNIRLQEGLNQAGWFGLAAELTGDETALSSLLAQLLQKGLPVVHFSEETQNLETVFLRATQGIVS